MTYWTIHSSFKLCTAEAPVSQVGALAQSTQVSDFVVQLRAICDSVLYAYLSKVADTEKNAII